MNKNNNSYKTKSYRCCEPELAKKYNWKALPIKNKELSIGKEDLLWFCGNHGIKEILYFVERIRKE